MRIDLGGWQRGRWAFKRYSVSQSNLVSFLTQRYHPYVHCSIIATTIKLNVLTAVFFFLTSTNTHLFISQFYSPKSSELAGYLAQIPTRLPCTLIWRFLGENPLPDSDSENSFQQSERVVVIFQHHLWGIFKEKFLPLILILTKPTLLTWCEIDWFICFC